jgi:hypothetical protein
MEMEPEDHLECFLQPSSQVMSVISIKQEESENSPYVNFASSQAPQQAGENDGMGGITSDI